MGDHTAKAHEAPRSSRDDAAPVTRTPEATRHRSRSPVRSLQRMLGNSSVESLVQTHDARRTGGDLPEAFRTRMERAFGADFSGVRVHENSHLARSLHAEAVTRGHDIHFAPGAYRPASAHGQEVLSHELAHVVQQRQGRVPATHVEHGHLVSERADLEAEADGHARTARRGGRIGGSVEAQRTPRVASSAVASGPLQLYRSVPTGATILSVLPDVDNIYLACSNLAHRVERRVAGNVNWAARIGPDLETELASNRLVPFRKRFTETEGINFDWSVSISWRINAERQVGGPTSAEVTRQGGGSTSVTSGSSSSTTDSAKATTSVGGHEGAPGAGAEVGTSSTETRTGSRTTTLQGGFSRRGAEAYRTYTADLVAMITVSGSANFSGSDYVNPFKWGTSIGSAITTNGTQGPTAYQAGRVHYQDSRPG